MDDRLARGTVRKEADRFLRAYDGSGTRGRTRICWWITCGDWSANAWGLGAVQLRGPERYLGLVGAEVRMSLGEPWRLGKHPYDRSALSTAGQALAAVGFHHPRGRLITSSDGRGACGA
ncbi:hypothetical protein ACIQZB_25190 [Streptomyces sp. NPDC097727]|uniref:hypothetical protein n=1 Tax=Streptomyces sp. NPDC097727 TaxID=3366092 RepID=UPI0037F885DD